MAKVRLTRRTMVRIASYLEPLAKAGELDGKTFPEVAELVKRDLDLEVTVWTIRAVKRDFGVEWIPSRVPKKREPKPETIAERVDSIEDRVAEIEKYLGISRTKPLDL